jgi:hypothetical protein
MMGVIKSFKPQKKADVSLPIFAEIIDLLLGFALSKYDYFKK